MNQTIQEQLDFAEILARRAHDGQFRRDGVTTYITHVDAVVSRVNDPYEIMVAYLHDTLEDTYVTLDDLLGEVVKGNIPASVVVAVDLLTKKKGEPYLDMIKRIKENKLATAVKIADNLSNLSDSPTDRQIIKYSKSLLILVD
jgi:(p)ppGpp synthase/HD superfamily hydrolase